MAHSGVPQFREALATFTTGMAVEPDNAMLYRWRGHRDLSVRELDRAMADLTRGGGSSAQCASAGWAGFGFIVSETELGRK